MTPRSEALVDEGHAATAATTAPLTDLGTARHVVAVRPVSSSYHSWRRHLKRGLDVGMVVIALPLVIPIALVVALAVVISSPGNPFFLQQRVGRNGKIFKCIKFRTMHTDAEQRLRSDPALHARYIANDYKLPAREDPRVIAIGPLLRHTSLDELPQLLNILLGHMSLVGPRPVVPDELDNYERWKGAYLAMRPGLTGAWQTNGRTHIRYPERAMLDAEYLEQWQFRTDLVILLKTIPTIVRRHGSN